MKLVSWNLNGLEDKNIDMRTEAAMFTMLLGAPIEKAMMEGFKPNTPDIIVLQEVVSRTFYAHLTPHLQAAGFTLFPNAPTERSYFEVIAVRTPIVESRYDRFAYTQQGRGLSHVEINGLTIFTAHLESQKAGKSMRLDQAEFILGKMNAHQGACIFAGDTNLRKAEWQSLKADNVIDAFENVGSPKKHKTTWFRESYKARYDRIWCKDISINSFETFGKNNVSGINETSSDHLGLRIEFSTEG